MLKIEKITVLFLFVLVILALVAPTTEAKASLADNLSGRILLQVEDNGEAWYVEPRIKKRIFLGRPSDAFLIMKEQGIGISNNDLNKIKIFLSLDNISGVDSDSDGLSDSLEIAIGTDPNNSDSDFDTFSDFTELSSDFSPLNSGKLSHNLNFSKKHAGKIFLQTEKNGEAWYVNPENNNRYFLGRPDDAFLVMKNLGLGISNIDLAKIPIFSSQIVSVEKCTSFVYSNWANCLPSNKQYRTIISSLPLSCTNEEAVLTQDCKYSTPEFSCGQSILYEEELYPSTKIGTQCWLAKNINVGKMINKDTAQSDNATIEKYCLDYNQANCDIYGGLYQWAETVQYKNGVSNISGNSSTQKNQGICPEGWHIPSNNEWSILEHYLASDTCGSSLEDWQCEPAGKRLKSSRTALGPNNEKVGTDTSVEPYWFYDENNYGINDVGFSAISAGMTREYKIPFSPGVGAWFWSATSYTKTNAWYFTLDATKAGSYRSYGNMYYKRANGFSVRCLMD